MKMGFKDIFQGSAAAGKEGHIFIDVPDGVYDGSLSVAFNIIGRFAQAASVKLLYIHSAKIQKG
jgi:hypothetical protein